MTRSGIISSSWVKLTSASVEIPLADQYQAWSNCERLIEHSQTESSYSIHSQAEHVTTMCLAEGIKRLDEWTFQGSSFQTFLGSIGVWQCLKCSSVWPTSKKDFCVIPKSCCIHTLHLLNTTVNTNKLKLHFRTDAANTIFFSYVVTDYAPLKDLDVGWIKQNKASGRNKE